MNVLVIGSGAREHAIAWSILKDPRVQKLYLAPGNGGARELGAIAERAPIKATDIDALLAFAKTKRIDLTVVGPEQPLELGVVNRFQAEGLNIIGPTKEAARLETSKAFAKAFMRRHRIPTAAFETFANHDEAKAFVERQTKFPIVVKASGLAAGKGVVIATSKSDALEALRAMFEQRLFGDAGSEVVIEEFLQGEEASVFVITDGEHYKLLPTAQDHKRIGEGDTGKNTGGMGAYSPAPIVTPDVMRNIERHIIQPTLRAMREEGTPYRGFLYVGLMICEGEPKVVEFNARLGDPEAQVVLPLLETSLLEILLATLDGRLRELEVKIADKCAATVVMASKGYPDQCETGKLITGQCHFELACYAGARDDVMIFHAGTTFENGKLYSNGGRVLSVTAVASSLEECLARCYDAISQIHFEGAYYRRDIGWRALRNLQTQR
ncbi:MAG: phosphoribosylamine--glycine ligase [Chloroherpetonaceae bacterium]|nr:phosphoribosylamine--glycine ligase [Chloroherpetonaceae bacterium]MDW8437741.1 phosphoribosylamine--glycine ligase [Chloroherpetonaceae bacterium]